MRIELLIHLQTLVRVLGFLHLASETGKPKPEKTAHYGLIIDYQRFHRHYFRTPCVSIICFVPCLRTEPTILKASAIHARIPTADNSRDTRPLAGSDASSSDASFAASSRTARANGEPGPICQRSLELSWARSSAPASRGNFT